MAQKTSDHQNLDHRPGNPLLAGIGFGILLGIVLGATIDNFLAGLAVGQGIGASVGIALNQGRKRPLSKWAVISIWTVFSVSVVAGLLLVLFRDRPLI